MTITEIVDDQVPAQEVPELEETSDVEDDGKGQSRGEKKARKAMSKLGLVAVSDVSRVTFKRSKNVYKSISKIAGDAFIVFGEAKVEDMSAQAAAQQLSKVAASAKAAEKAPAAAITEEADEAVDETGVEAKDIELVMSQANVSRAKAVKALKAADNDIVNAIMDLTM